MEVAFLRILSQKNYTLSRNSAPQHRFSMHGISCHLYIVLRTKEKGALIKFYSPSNKYQLMSNPSLPDGNFVSKLLSNLSSSARVVGYKSETSRVLQRRFAKRGTCFPHFNIFKWRKAANPVQNSKQKKKSFINKIPLSLLR